MMRRVFVVASTVTPGRWHELPETIRPDYEEGTTRFVCWEFPCPDSSADVSPAEIKALNFRDHMKAKYPALSWSVTEKLQTTRSVE